MFRMRPITFVLHGMLGLVIAFTLGIASPAKADWWPAYAFDVDGANHGPDFYQAAVDDLFHNYPNVTFDGDIQGFTYDTNGLPVSFIVNGVVGITPVTGSALARCTNGRMLTLLGCTTGVTSYQGEPICRLSVGNPLNVISGNKFEAATDFKSVGAESLTFSRYYNSDQAYLRAQPATKSRFGYGWRSEYDRNILANGSPADATAVDAIRADGRPIHFIKSGSSWYVAYWNTSIHDWSPPSDPLHDIDIHLSTDGTEWFIVDDNDTVETYDSTYDSDRHNYFGKLISIRERSGYQRTLTYDSSLNNTLIADSLGRQLVLAYLANGLLDTMRDQDNNITHYAYSDRSGFSPPPPPGAAGLWVLEQVTFADATFVTYQYEDTRPINRFALTGLTDENGKRFATWAYDFMGRAVSSQHAGGADLTTVSFDDANTRTVTNPLTKQAIYHLESFQSELRINHVDGQPSAHCPGSTESYDYDSNGFVQDETSGEGRVIHYIHNAIGQETSRTRGYGTGDASTITTSWNSSFHVPDEIDQLNFDQPNLKTNFYYTSGLLTTLTETDMTTQSIPYSTNGQQRTWQFSYWPSGLLHTVDGPLAGTSDTVTYSYNATGFVSSISDELLHITQITAWNGRGQPLTSIDPNNITTNYTYDLRGRLKSITVNPGANQALTSFGYDSAGNVSSIISPDGSTLTYHYDDAHRLVSIFNNSNESITYTLDAMGDATQTVVRTMAGGIMKSQTATFDELGRLLNEIGAATQTTQHAYDKDDNEITTIDPRGKIYGHAFDALNRLYQETDPFHNQTTLVYNGKDEVTSVVDARTLATTYVRDGFGDAIQQVSPDTGTTVLWYDGLGDVTKRTDSRSVETDFTYDVKGRIKTRKIHGTTAENVTFTYDTLSGSTYGIDRLRKIADPSGSTTFSYDPLGHVTKEVRVIQFNNIAYTYNVSFTSDAAGHPLTIAYPSGRIVTYTRNSLGRISGITTKQNSGSSAVTIASNVSYQPFGPIASLQFGNGISLSQTYDLDYQLTGIVATNGTTTIQNLTYGYDPAGNISPITDNFAPARSQSFVYDDLNRITSASGLYGAQGYGYNATSGRTSRTAGGTTETYGISPTSNRLNVVTISTNVRSFSYLPTGQVTNDNRDSSHAYVYGYNNVGRLSSVTLNGSTAATYLTNGAEQRVVKTIGSATTHFIFDRLGHLLAEADGTSGVTQKEYIWLDDIPVAMVDNTGPSPVIYYIHTDHLGTPQKMTDSAANLVWDGIFDPFGNAFSVTGGATNNLRFPGQYFDVEAGLAQNWNRDYDASIGRYTESDPIGLAGGINAYGYADQNPLSEFDPVGTCPFCLAIPFLCYGGVCEAIIGATLVAIGLSTPEGKKEVNAAGRAIAKLCPDPDEECNRLNGDVQVAKGLTAALGKCRPGMSRWQLQLRYTAWLKEAVARARRDQKCWVGGDMGHQTAQAQAWTNVGNCGALLK